MSDQLLNYGIASYVSENILIVPFQTEFYADGIEAFRQEILKKIHETNNLKGMIIDVSQVNLLDVSNMKELESILSMSSVLGVTGYLVGLKPAVAVALVELGYEGNKLNIALNVEQAAKSIQEGEALKMRHDDELESDHESEDR